MEQLTSSQPFPPMIFDCFTSSPRPSLKSKATTMSYSQHLPLKKGYRDYRTTPLSSSRHSQSYDTERELGQSNNSPTTPPPPFNTTTSKSHRDRDTTTEITLHQLPNCRTSIGKGDHNPAAIDPDTKLNTTTLNTDAQHYFSERNNNHYVHKSSHLLLSGSFGSPSRSLTPPRDRSGILEPLPNIWSKVSPIPQKQERHSSPDHFRPHAELLLHLRRSPALHPTLVSLSAPDSSRPSLHAQSPAPPPLQASLTPIPHHRSRRANDYTGEFKREFCVLLAKHSDARAQWEHFWRRRECTGRRPCIKSYLAFCDLYAEFAKLRRIHKYRVLGTRTNCECGLSAHAEPPASRFAPYWYY